MNELSKEINKQFKETREALKLTQLDCAVILGVSHVTYNKWEQRPETMPIGKYEQLMHKFEELKKLQGE